jgi:hypothetical protein
MAIFNFNDLSKQAKIGYNALYNVMFQAIGNGKGNGYINSYTIPLCLNSDNKVLLTEKNFIYFESVIAELKVIGDYTIPVDKNGNVSGGLKVANFRPYVGLGFGRVVPKKRINFMFEMGVQFHKTPEVYTDYGDLGSALEEADDAFSDIIEKITIYPVLKLRLNGRIF